MGDASSCVARAVIGPLVDSQPADCAGGISRAWTIVFLFVGSRLNGDIPRYIVPLILFKNEDGEDSSPMPIGYAFEIMIMSVRYIRF